MDNAAADIRNHDPWYIHNDPENYIKSGIVEGLSTLKSYNAYCYEGVDLTVLDTSFSLRNFKFLINWEGSFLFTFSGTIQGKANELRLDVEVEIDKIQRIFKVTKAKPSNLEDIELSFTGFGIMESVVKRRVEKILKEDAENLLKSLVVGEIGKWINAH